MALKSMAYIYLTNEDILIRELIVRTRSNQPSLITI